METKRFIEKQKLNLLTSKVLMDICLEEFFLKLVSEHKISIDSMKALSHEWHEFKFKRLK